ncbi:MAG: hypothetical protein QM773_21345 [Hyphomonadaceae bacterium]
MLKEASAWLTQKIGRMKLQLSNDAFSIFEALEVLSLGSFGKAALWKALQHSTNLKEFDLPKLIERADRQHSVVETAIAICKTRFEGIAHVDAGSKAIQGSQRSSLRCASAAVVAAATNFQLCPN